MIMDVKTIRLTEYKTETYPADFIEEEAAKQIWLRLGSYVDIEQPSWKNDEKWEFRSKGWVGYIPVDEDLVLHLQPKVRIKNIFRMLEYAYRLDFKTYEGLYESDSLEEFYENLAKILSLKVLDRKRKGLYREYINRQESLPYVRGRIQFREMYKKPWQVRVPNHYQEHTPNISDNQILAWTLYVILRSGICGEETTSVVRKAYRDLQRVVEVSPYSAQDCINRLYDRLNEDYRPMHALCRFFLDNSGPTIYEGENEMLPFLIDMSQLYELFVAEWLRENLPKDYELDAQHTVSFGDKGSYRFTIDLVISDASTGEVVYVLDTKYKTPDKPSNPDINQIVAYSEAKGCQQAVLIYPEKIGDPRIGKLGEINIRALTFSIEGDLESAGDRFVSMLFDGV